MGRPVACTDPCKPGCRCKDNYYKHGDRCLRLSDCKSRRTWLSFTLYLNSVQKYCWSLAYTLSLSSKTWTTFAHVASKSRIFSELWAEIKQWLRCFKAIPPGLGFWRPRSLDRFWNVTQNHFFFRNSWQCHFVLMGFLSNQRLAFSYVASCIVSFLTFLLLCRRGNGKQLLWKERGLQAVPVNLSYDLWQLQVSIATYLFKRLPKRMWLPTWLRSKHRRSMCAVCRL